MARAGDIKDNAESAPASSCARSQAEEMEFDPHGAPHNRPVLARGCAARTQDMRAEERALTLHGLVGVQLDARACISYDDVHRDALQQLRIPAQDLEVTCLRAATFLLRFAMPELRAAALRCSALEMLRPRDCLVGKILMRCYEE